MHPSRGAVQPGGGYLPPMQPPRQNGSEEALQALVALARRGPPPPLPRSRASRDAVLGAAARHAVPGLVLTALSRQGNLDPAEMARLHLLRRQAARWDLELGRVLRRLSGAGVRAIVLKGAALRVTAYRDPAEREFTDLDLLVPMSALKQSVSALEALGYQAPTEQEYRVYLAHHHHVILNHPQGFVVEMHWALEPPSSPFRLDADRVRESAVEAAVPGSPPLLVPSAEHMVLHLAHQNLENGFAHLRRLVDIDRAIAAAPEFDWERLASEAEWMRVRAPLALTLRLAELLLGTEVPAGFVSRLGVSGAARAHLGMLDPVRVLLEQRGERREIEEALLLWCLPGAGARLGRLADVATGKRESFCHEVSGVRGNPLVNLWALARFLGSQVAAYRGIGRAGRFWREGSAGYN